MMKLLYIQGKIDVNVFKERCTQEGLLPQRVVFLFPGNRGHHTSVTTLFSIKHGGGLAAVATALGEAGFPTLSLPTTTMENWADNKEQQNIATQAISDLYRALGAGFSLMLPVRNYSGRYFPEPLDSVDGQDIEPSFWGGVQAAENIPLAGYYIQQLKTLKLFTEHPKEKNAASPFYPVYLEGKNRAITDRH